MIIIWAIRFILILVILGLVLISIRPGICWVFMIY